MASPNGAFTTMVTTFGLSGIVGKLGTDFCKSADKVDSCDVVIYFLAKPEVVYIY